MLGRKGAWLHSYIFSVSLWLMAALLAGERKEVNSTEYLCVNPDESLIPRRGPASIAYDP
jgi:hypothetical protein